MFQRYDSFRIDLLCMLQADKDLNDILFEVFLKAATLSLERMAKEVLLQLIHVDGVFFMISVRISSVMSMYRKNFIIR